MSLQNNLRLKGKQLQICRKLPKDVRQAFGAKTFVFNTGIADLLKAARIRDRLLAELDARVEAVRSAFQCTAADILTDLQTLDAESRLVERELANVRYGVALHRSIADQDVPLDKNIDRFVSESAVTDITKQARRFAIKRLCDWTHDPSLRALSRRKAGEYASHLVSQGLAGKTINSQLSHLSAYWKWLIKRGLACENVCQGQQISTKGREKPRLAWTKVEVCKLIELAPTNLLKDVSAITALSGLRAGELAGMRVADCQEGMFNIRVSKSDAGVRTVPVHSQLVDTVAERMRAKKPDDYLFHEVNGSSKSLVKRFARYRASLYGKSDSGQADKTFHSFRHHFIDERLKAGVELRLVQLVVGHQPEGGVTTRVYGHGITDRRARTVVDAASLPL